MSKTIKTLMSEYKSALKDIFINTYDLDVELLLMEVTGFEKHMLYLDINYMLTDEQYNKFILFINRRLKNEPIAYIICKCEFMGIPFTLNKDTLIPRQDTEILVEEVIKIIKDNNLKTMLDIGTGSGAIAISVCKYTDIDIVAIDINENAIKKANQNNKANNTNVKFLHSNLFDVFENTCKKFDIIVSNPPYIKTNIINTLMNDVKDYEPHIALDGGKTGIIFYEKIIEKAKIYLNSGGFLAFEIGHDQKILVSDLLYKNGFKNIKNIKDLADNDRVITANN